MTKDRAIDFINNDMVDRVCFAFKLYHPKFRGPIIAFLDRVFLDAVNYLSVKKLI